MSVNTGLLIKHTIIIMSSSVNQVANSFNGLAIAFEHNADANNTQTETEGPVVVFSRAFHSPRSAPTGLCPDDMSLITRQVVSKLGEHGTIVVLMNNHMKTRGFDRYLNVEVTAAGGVIIAASNSMLVIIKDEQTLMVHFLAACSYDQEIEIVRVPATPTGSSYDHEIEIVRVPATPIGSDAY